MQGKVEGALPPKRGGRQEVYRVTTTSIQTFTIISESVFGVYIHWANGRSRKCNSQTTLPDVECPGCTKPYPRKWKAYLDAYRHESEVTTRMFLELTQVATEQIWKAMRERESLRGIMMRVRKTAGGAKGRYLIELLDRSVDPATLPDVNNPEQILSYLWTVNAG